jgi:hypothetical protein
MSSATKVLNISGLTATGLNLLVYRQLSFPQLSIYYVLLREIIYMVTVAARISTISATEVGFSVPANTVLPFSILISARSNKNKQETAK